MLISVLQLCFTETPTAVLKRLQRLHVLDGLVRLFGVLNANQLLKC